MKKTFIKFRIVILLLVVAICISCVLFFYPFNSSRQIRNILLISIDTCRADYLSCYGYSRKTTPNIDAVAAEGFLFENVISPVPMTLPAHCSMLTGTTPLHHGIHDNIGYKLGPSNITLAEILSENGYKTAAVIGSFVLDSQFGLKQGFDSYYDRFEEKVTTGRFLERKGQEVSRFGIDWLGENYNEPFFLFLHYYDPHFRYEPPEPFASSFKDDLYAGEIAYTDHCVGQVIQKLKKLGIYDSTLLIITSDHGEMLGEHGEIEHGYFIYQSAIKVPLIIKLAGRSKPQKINRLASLNDIVPTICGLLGIRPPSQIQGKDLSVNFAENPPTEKRYVYCESFTPTKHNANPLFALISDQWKYIDTTRTELYNLDEDPAEQNNLVTKESQRAYQMRGQLKLTVEKLSPKNGPSSKLQLDEAGKKRLASLGYIDSESADYSFEIDHNKPDAKDLVKFHSITSFNKATLKLAQEGKLTEAANAYRELIDHYEKVKIQHDMATIYHNFGVLLKKIGNQQESRQILLGAASRFRKELEKNKDSVALWNRLGDTHASLGNFKAACEAFKRALRLEPNNLFLYDSLVKALEYDEQYDEAIRIIDEQIQLISRQGHKNGIEKLRKYIEFLEDKKSKTSR